MGRSESRVFFMYFVRVRLYYMIEYQCYPDSNPIPGLGHNTVTITSGRWIYLPAFLLLLFKRVYVQERYVLWCTCIIFSSVANKIKLPPNIQLPRLLSRSPLSIPPLLPSLSLPPCLPAPLPTL